MKGRSFTWNDRLTLINHYKPTDEQACKTFSITQPELDVARNQLRAGVFSLSNTLDVDSYADLFSSNEATNNSSTTVTATKAPIRTTTVTSTKVPPETATARSREAKKRGRKGDKITQAFTSIPSSPTMAEEFAKTHGVSIAVLRQSKRFDVPELKVNSTVRVKKDKTSKMLMIWREQN